MSQNGIVVKEHSVATNSFSDSFRFKSPYIMIFHSSENNGQISEDGHLSYHKMYTVVSEAEAGLPHLYVYCARKCKFLIELLWAPYS